MGQFALDYAGDSYQVQKAVYAGSAAAVTASKLAYTRAVGASYEPAAGGVTKFAANVFRRGDKGALVEPSDFNQVWTSEDMTTATGSLWTVARGVITGNTTTAPDGTTTADTFSDQTLNNGHVLQNRNANYSYALGSTYCMSMYMQSAGSGGTLGQYGILGQSAARVGAVDQGAVFDLVNGTFNAFGSPAGAGMYSVGSGWYRCWVAFTITSAGFGSTINFGTAITSTATTLFPTYLGANRLWNLWGGQLEVGSFPTTYIPVPASTVQTRGADSITWTLPAIGGPGTYDIRYTFDDNSTQDVLGISPTYVTPTTLNRPYIKSVTDITAYATPAKVQGASVWSPANAGPTVTIAGATAGNLLTAHVVSAGYLSGTPTGWTLLTSDLDTANAGMRLYARVASGTSADNFTYAMGGAYNSTVTWVEWSGIDTTGGVAGAQAGMTPPATLQDSPGDNTITSPVIAPIPLGCLVIATEGASGATSLNWSVTPTCSNGFTVAQYAGQNAPGGSGAGIDNLCSCQAYKVITGDNATTYGTVFTLTGTYPGVTSGDVTSIVAFRPVPSTPVIPGGFLPRRGMMGFG